MCSRPLRSPPCAAWLATTLLALLALTGCGPGTHDRPIDVLLISLDSTRADALTFLDPERAPHLAELARRGTVFTQAIAGSSWTLPSHMQMFTGQPPVMHGVQIDDVRLDPLAPTLPEVLGGAGWATHGAWTAWYLRGDYGFARGFDSYRNGMSSGIELDAAIDQAIAADDWRAANQAFLRRDVQSHRDVSAPRVVELLTEDLAALAPDQPALLFAHFMDPHYDYIPPAPFDTRFDPDYTGDIDGHDFWRNRLIWEERPEPRRICSDRDLLHLEALYQGEIAWTDQAIGALLDALEVAGRLERTLIVVTSDHGQEFFEHGAPGHRRTLHDEVVRVPLLVVPPAEWDATARGRQDGAADSAPGGTGVRVVDQQVSLSDITPTILDYVGLEPPPNVTGRSLRPLVEGATLPERPVLSSLFLVSRAPDRPREAMLLESLRLPDEKLLRRIHIRPDGNPEVDAVLWYDLRRDPGELFGISDRSHPRLRKAWDRLEQEQARLRRHWATLPRSPRDARRTRIAEVFAPDLAALGYLGQSTAGGARPPEEWGLGPLPPLSLD